ncbi:hypothetical protein PIB30_077073 [Stylosanthes scabra]|uniref:Uncharacterized protein n=1 Tax=Stylosanthes scabra TaxID=79078 RepID=A0ABU6XNE5_9FABA|nr:hypothetical protein [Stylosanthes scabra]
MESQIPSLESSKVQSMIRLIPYFDSLLRSIVKVGRILAVANTLGAFTLVLGGFIVAKKFSQSSSIDGCLSRTFVATTTHNHVAAVPNPESGVTSSSRRVVSNREINGQVSATTS